ncbi:MAG: hypothetical protein L0206_20975, partial [Actinobacteria bacterium]|nr:hypothetical protein [Actinomycetota bacterium]
EGKVHIEAMQDVFGVGATIFSAPPGSGWFPPSTALTPFTTQAVFDAPYWFILTDTIPEAGVGERVLALGRRPSGTDTLVRLNVDPGSGYVEVAVSGQPAFTPAGLLDVALAENTVDIFSTGIVVNTPSDFEGVVAATAARIEAEGVNLIRVDDEIMAFETATYNSGTAKWTLGNLHRGLLDTLPAAHSPGAVVWVLTLEIAASGLDPLLGMLPSAVPYAGTAALNAKLLPENASRTLALASATALPLTMSRRTEKPLPVGQFRVSSVPIHLGTARYPVIVGDGDVTIAWQHRHRGDVKILDQNDGDSTLGLDANTTYEYTWFVLDSGSPVQVRQATQTTTSFTYTRADQTTDNGGVPPQALRARLRSKDT